jgi:DNA-binding transcriptional regulator YhcF (GntR family)
MIIRVDTSDPTPTYEQIRAQVTAMAAAGTLPVGTRLPTIRQLSADLGLAKGTVAKAYEELERSGTIATEGRRGSFVRAPDERSTALVDSTLATAAEAFAVTVVQLGVSADDAVAAALRAIGRFRPD